MPQNYSELRKDNVRDAIYEDVANNLEVLRTSWSGNAFPENPKVGQPCYRVDEDKLYYWDGYKWSQKGGGGSAELKTMELAAATSERVSITLEGARCLDKNMMFVFVDKIAQDPSTYSMNDDGTVVNFNPAIPANAAVTLRWFDTDVGTFDTAIFASDAEFAAGELTNRAPNVKQVHSLSDQIQTSNANYVKSELQSNLLNYTTNRILEIPQDIKLELNNGTLTLKAGSKVYVPNGVGVFEVKTAQQDFTMTRNTNAKELVFVRWSGDNITSLDAWAFCYSGSSAPSGEPFMAWYDTSNNVVKGTANGGSTWTETLSFSIAAISEDSTKITSIDQIFNGFGYIGSSVFVLPGVKVQIPNGRNEDGTYINYIEEITSVKTNTFTSESGSVDLFYNSDIKSLGAAYTGTYIYDSSTNSYVNKVTRLNVTTLINVANCICTSGKISSFKFADVDSVANSNASNFSQAGRSYLSGLGMPSGRYIDLTLGASGSTYTAPANGWFCLLKVANDTQHVTMLTKGGSFGVRNVASANTATLVCFCPVIKGDIMALTYNASGATTSFKFYYAEGDQ